MVDIISNECGLALAAALKLPVVGFWGFSFVGGEVRTAREAAEGLIDALISVFRVAPVKLSVVPSIHRWGIGTWGSEKAPCLTGMNQDVDCLRER